MIFSFSKKVLKDKTGYKIRVGNYRVIYDMMNKELIIFTKENKFTINKDYSAWFSSNHPVDGATESALRRTPLLPCAFRQDIKPAVESNIKSMVEAFKSPLQVKSQRNIIVQLLNRQHYILNV